MAVRPSYDFWWHPNVTDLLLTYLLAEMTVPASVTSMIEKIKAQILEIKNVIIKALVRFLAEIRPKKPLRRKKKPHQIPYAES